MTRFTLAAVLPLAACGGTATWAPETWGEDFIEAGIPADTFADGCSADFDHFWVRVTAAALVDGDDQEVAGLDAPVVVDLVPAGPHLLPTIEADAGFYDTARFGIGPGAADPDLGEAAIRVVGAVTCAADTVSFDLSFDAATTYDCDPEDLTLVRGESVGTQLTVHGDHLFYDSLEGADAEVRGQAYIDADADLDGVLTAAELAATPVAPLGYDVGSQGDVADLYSFVDSLVGALGHIDGEGHCNTR